MLTHDAELDYRNCQLSNFKNQYTIAEYKGAVRKTFR